LDNAARVRLVGGRSPAFERLPRSATDGPAIGPGRKPDRLTRRHGPRPTAAAGAASHPFVLRQHTFFGHGQEIKAKAFLGDGFPSLSGATVTGCRYRAAATSTAS